MTNIFKRVAAMLMALAMIASMAACKDSAGEKEKKTEAVKVGEHILSAVELNYFFVDAVVDWYSVNSNYAHLMGFDASKPLSEQVISSATGETWADSFLDTAMDNIRSTYALYDLAMANGFTLSAADRKQVTNHIMELEKTIEYYNKQYASMGYTSPYASVDEYLLLAYGEGASQDSYMHYYEVCITANAYFSAYGDTLSYTDKTLREYEADKYEKYNSFTYAVYYVAVKDYSSAEEAEGVANQLAAGNYADQAALDEAIKALAINEGKQYPKLSEHCYNKLYSKVPAGYVEWLADSKRVSGDMTVAPHLLVADDESSLQGYYVVLYESVNENKYVMKNVRHVLCAYKGGVMNAVTGETVYSDKEKEAAKKNAESLYLQFRTGTMTELIFATMADQYSDDGDGTTGGLYENVYMGQMAKEFEDWCYDPIRRTGDVEMVETEYGWHIIYFVENADDTYRDYLLTNDKKAEDLKAWYDHLFEQMQIELLNDKFVNKDMVLSK